MEDNQPTTPMFKVDSSEDPSKSFQLIQGKTEVETPPYPKNQFLTKYYKTQTNDSMLKIAYLFNMNITNLKRMNDLLSEELYSGQIIKVNVASDAEILRNPQFTENLADDELELKKRSQANQSLASQSKQGLRSSFLSQKNTTESFASPLSGNLATKSFNKQDLSSIDEVFGENQIQDLKDNEGAQWKLQKKGETMKQVPLHILEQIQGIKQANDRGPSNTVYDKNRSFQIKSEGSGGSDSGNQTTSITHEDIQSQFDNIQMGYQKIQESFNKHQEQQSQDGSRGDILKLFTKISTQDKKKMTECDKIQLSYFIQNQSDKIRTEAYYCTKNGKAKGNLTLTEHLVLFDPIKCAENEGFTDLEKYQAVIDLWDVVSAQKIRTESDTIQFITDPEMRKFYNQTYYIQINLSSINGMTIKRDAQLSKFEYLPSMQIPALKHVLSTGEEVKKEDSKEEWLLFDDENLEREEVDEVYRKQAYILAKQASVQEGVDHSPEMFGHLGQRTTSIAGIQKKYQESIATVFFRFSHRDRKNQLITNQDQKQIVDNIYNKLLENMKKVKTQAAQELRMSLSHKSYNGTSRTHLNFFDQVVGEGDEQQPPQYDNHPLITSSAEDMTFKFQKPPQKTKTLTNEPLKKGKRLLEDKLPETKPNVIRATDVFSGEILLKGHPVTIRKDRLISSCLPEFTPITKSDSNIMDNKMRGQIALYLPSLVRMREWTLLFTTAKDGVSYTTFYSNVQDRDNTVLLIKDTQGKIFGAYCSEFWRKAMHFYGYGDSFVFNFDEDHIIQPYKYTGANEKIQFSNERCIIIGGGSPHSQKSEAAIYISVDFYKGHSGDSETFENPILSSEKDFCIAEFEVWGFDSI